MKKKILPALAFAAPFAVLAEGESSSATATAVTGMLTGTQTALEGLVTSGLPIVTTLVIAGLTIWGGFKLVRLIMKAFGFGTSR